MSHISTRDLSNIKTVIFDCDGVLWIGDNLIDGALDLYKFLMESGRRVFFVTNNSTKTCDEYLEKFKSKGFHPPVQRSQFLGAAKIMAHYLESQNITHCHVVGAKAIDHEMSLLGITVNRHEEQFEKMAALGGMTTKEGTDYFKHEFTLDDKVQAVVMGMDLRVNYQMIAIAATYIQNRNAKFLMTNPDASLPNDSDKVMPGGGCLMGAIQTTVQRPVDFIAGKPSPFTSQYLIPDFEPATSMMVGDRIETDVMFGVNSKCGVCCLVLSGASGQDKISEVDRLDRDGSNSSKVNYGESVREILQQFKN